MEHHDNNNNHNINHDDTVKDTTNNKNIYENHRQPVNSTELAYNSYPLNTNIPPLPNINTPLLRLHQHNSVHFKFRPVILNTYTQPISTTNQNLQLTPQ